MGVVRHPSGRFSSSEPRENRERRNVEPQEVGKQEDPESGSVELRTYTREIVLPLLDPLPLNARQPNRAIRTIRFLTQA
jgi:hypothetical protein